MGEVAGNRGAKSASWKCRLPEDITFMSKPQLAAQMLEEMVGGRRGFDDGRLRSLHRS